MKPQTKAIADHLFRFGTITPQLALREYGCFRLAARIEEIRKAGHQVETIYKTIRRRGEPVRFAQYRYHARRSAA
jgi:hypothetical protein